MWSIDASMPAITRRLAGSSGGLRSVLLSLRDLGALRIRSDAGSPEEKVALPDAGADVAIDRHRDPAGPRRPCDLVDFDPALESARLRLFVMTGRYWRGM